MTPKGLAFAEAGGPSSCVEMDERYLEYGTQPFDEFALCEPLIEEVARKWGA